MARASLAADLTASLRGPDDPAARDFSRHFRDAFGDSLLAVILYGSCTSEATRRPSSIYDFILLCDD